MRSADRAHPEPERRTRLPKPRTSYAVLIGVGGYQHLPPVPGVVNNAVGLHRMLSMDGRGAFLAENCILQTDIADPGTAAGILLTAAQKATDVFLVYFTGHGLRDPYSGELHFALCATNDTLGMLSPTSLSLRELRDIYAQSAAPTKVLILDCCYSGAATASWLGPEQQITPQIDGTYVLSSTNAIERSPAPGEDDAFTPFTGALIAALRDGIPGSGPWLTLRTLFRHVERVLAGSPGPEPTQLNTGLAESLALARNAAFADRRPLATKPTRPGRGPTAIHRAAGHREHTAPEQRQAPKDERAAGSEQESAATQNTDDSHAADATDHGARDNLLRRHAAALAAGLRGEPDSAVELLRTLLAEFVRLLGAEAPETLTCQHNLAYWMHQAGDGEQALKLYQKTIEARARTLGADHSSTVKSRESMAAAAWDVHRTDGER